MPKLPNPLLRRAKSSASSGLRRGGRSSATLPEKELEHNRLEDVGIIPRLPTPSAKDVVSLVCHILDHTFEPIPERAAGLTSRQIAETLQFRARLPPIVSIAHLHALSASATETERELARLVATGVVRKVTIPGRGKGGTAVGEGIVLVQDWKARITADVHPDEEGLKQKYIALMTANPTSQIVSVTNLSKFEIRELVELGFLTNPSALLPINTFPSSASAPSSSGSGSIATAGHASITGTYAAIGGQGAIHTSGGGGSTLATQHNRPPHNKPSSDTMTFSLPSTGSYLRLLIESRQHLLHLLKRLSPRYRECTRNLLEEKWNGNAVREAKSAVLPGHTRRWKTFHGLHFEWVLAECVGSGLVELFDTGVGVMGVRGI